MELIHAGKGGAESNSQQHQSPAVDREERAQSAGQKKGHDGVFRQMGGLADDLRGQTQPLEIDMGKEEANQPRGPVHGMRLRPGVGGKGKYEQHPEQQQQGIAITVNPTQNFHEAPKFLSSHFICLLTFMLYNSVKER